MVLKRREIFKRSLFKTHLDQLAVLIKLRVRVTLGLGLGLGFNPNPNDADVFSFFQRFSGSNLETLLNNGVSSKNQRRSISVTLHKEL